MHTLLPPRRILVIDDDADAVDMLVELLEVYGHTVAAATSGYSGLQLVATFAPDVVLLDLGMPGLDGYQVADELRKQRLPNNVKIIALTGSGDYDSRVRVRNGGFHMHIVKPANVETLLMAVTQTM